MKKQVLLALILLTGCGAYIGTEGLIIYPGLIEEGGNKILGGEVIMTAVTSIFGVFAPYIVGAGGVVGVILSVFITKRKKGK